MDELILYLLKAGAGRKPVRLTTTELGGALGMTQQNASRRLLLLEAAGQLQRTAGGIAITGKCMKELRSLYAAMKESFEGSAGSLSGVVSSGLGEGRYYLSLPGYRENIEQAVGIFPYAGTLNLRLEHSELWKKEALLSRSVLIPNFTHGGRRYGSARVCPCTVGKMKAAIIFPERTHHPENIVEVIAAKNLRQALRKKDGDRVVLSFGGAVP